jgi:very-short-patch-repair endonuclease
VCHAPQLMDFPCYSARRRRCFLLDATCVTLCPLSLWQVFTRILRAGLVALVFIFAVLGVLAAKRKPRDGLFSKPWPLEAKRQLLTERERALYQRLVQTLPHHIVLAQVQLLQVLKFQAGRRTQAIFNRISQLSIDFLIINPDTSIVAAVELDDATHASEKRRQADARKDHALKSAGVPLIRWNSKNLPDRVAILAAIPIAATTARGNS